jgi:hypothetical protein
MVSGKLCGCIYTFMWVKRIICIYVHSVFTWWDYVFMYLVFSQF